MIIYSMAYATTLVADGVKWANAHYDADWVWTIDPDRLNIGNGEDCFFGQMYADLARINDYQDGWHYATENGVIAWDRTYALGLAVKYDHERPDEWTTNVRSINAAWRAQIGQLRKTVPQPVG